jgi:hypothetical protein
MTKADEIFAEALLRAAVVANCEREMDELEADTTEMHFSERHEKRMRRLFAKERAKGRIAKIWVVARKVTIAAAIFIVLLSSALMLNTRVRAAVSDTTAKWHEDFTNFVSKTDNIEATYVEWTFGYIPDGFAMQSIYFLKGHTDVQYAGDGGKRLHLRVYPSGTGSIGIDPAYSQYRRIVYNNEVEYQIFSTEDDSYPSHIIWERNGYIFLVSSELEADILLDIAFSVRQK